MQTPLILEIKGNSLDDGPGIRSVVFFKGCPLNCSWCHNPESKRRTAELAFERELCIGCGDCARVCPANAINLSQPGFVDRQSCTLCGACTEACPATALKPVGRTMTVAEIVGQVLRDRPFFDTSGGGVTLSGGEPTLFMDFSAELLAALKAAGIHTLVETCGYFNLDEFCRKVLPHTDQIFMDIKIFDRAAHRRHCGVDNTLILENFRALHSMARRCGFEILPRTPLVPGISDTPDNLRAIAAFLAANQVSRVQLLSYNPLWQDKNHRLGQAWPFGNNPQMQQWTSPRQLDACRRIFRESGLEVV